MANAKFHCSLIVFPYCFILLLAALQWGCTEGIELKIRDQADEPLKESRAGLVTESRVLNENDRAINWLVGGGNYEKHHYSILDQISRENVSTLQPAWTLEIDSPMGLSSEPIIVDGVAYITAPLSIIYAVDIRTGKLIWEFDPKVDLKISMSSSWAARTNRGAAVWDGLVYVGTGDCRVVAVNASTGTPVWDTAICDPKNHGGITGAPRVGGGKIFMGYGIGELGARGSLVALDAVNGKELWRFWTVPGETKNQHESKVLERASATWANGVPPMGGGVVWDAITYDAKTSRVFFGTASAVPYIYPAREPHGGDNLYTNSVIAVDADTGKYAWHYQTTPEDSWDYDAAMHIMVADLDIDGGERRVVMQVPKNGFFYVLDARSGQLISADAIVRTSWASSIDLNTGRPVFEPDARYYNFPETKTRVWPAVTGAHNWQAMSFNPETGLVYIPANELGGYYSVDREGNGVYETSSYDDGGNLIEYTGRLIAWDPVRKKPKWKVPLQQAHNSGVLATAGNLVFMGETSGTFSAYDALTGEKHWGVKVGSSMSGNPATAMVDGEQYILMNAGH